MQGYLTSIFIKRSMSTSNIFLATFTVSESNTINQWNKVSHCVLSLPSPRGALKFIWTPYSCDIIFKLFSLTYRPRIVYKVELPVFSIFIIAKCLCGTLQLLPVALSVSSSKFLELSLFFLLLTSLRVMVGFKLPVGVVSTSVWLLVAFLSHVHCLWSSPTIFYTIICQNKMST